MVKSVSSCCVRGRWVLSNPVTYINLYCVGLTCTCMEISFVMYVVVSTLQLILHISSYIVSYTAPCNARPGSLSSISHMMLQ